MREPNVNHSGFLAYDAEVKRTKVGTPYLTEPGVALISRPNVNLETIRGFIDGFGDELQFADYLEDDTILSDGAEVCKFAGQNCYLSLGPTRTKNADAKKYFDNIKSSSHGSVLEHANYGFLFYGDSRSFTHELVRHRVGIGYSQVSQRYVDGTRLRFVERPEYVGDDELHARFERWIDLCAEEYDWRADALLKRQKSGDQSLVGLSKTDLRKRVNQAARSCLPNETEAPIVVTANARTWRHITEMRGSKMAEPEIRRVAILIMRCLRTAASELFDDYREVDLPDGTSEVQTEWRKV